MAIPGSLVNRALRSRLLRQQSARSGVRIFEQGHDAGTIREYSQHIHVRGQQPVLQKREYSLTSQDSSRSTPPQSIDIDDVFRPFDLGKGTNPVQFTDTDKDIRKKRQDGRFLGRLAERSKFQLEIQASKEIVWLKDPHMLEDRIARILRDDRIQMAAALVREAQRNNMKCVVAWNHIFQYLMDKKRLKEAFKFYNDVSAPSDFGSDYARGLRFVMDQEQF